MFLDASEAHLAKKRDRYDKPGRVERCGSKVDNGRKPVPLHSHCICWTSDAPFDFQFDKLKACPGTMKIKEFQKKITWTKLTGELQAGASMNKIDEVELCMHSFWVVYFLASFL